MNCHECREWMHPHVDGELDIRGSLELDHHLANCPGCAAEKEALRFLKATLRRSSLRYHAPVSLRRRFRHLCRPSNNTALGKLSVALWLWRSWAIGATALALLMAFVLPTVSGRNRLLDEVVASHVRSLMADHLTDVLSNDQHTVKPWFTGKLDFSPRVEDFAGRGFPLIGGRLDYLGGREVAVLVYRHNKHVINVYVWPAADSGAGLPSVGGRRGYSLISREATGFHHLLVSDLNRKELADLADLLER
jgi:anti-sigma factor RsiW